MKDFIECTDKLSNYFLNNNKVSDSKRYKYIGKKYKLSINIFTKEGYVKGVITNCNINCCGLYIGECRLSNRQLKKLIETGIYNYGQGKRSY